MFLGLKAIQWVFATAFYPLIVTVQAPQHFEFWYWVGSFILFLIPIAAALLYIRLTDRAVLSTLAPKKGAGRALIIGSLAGAAVNAKDAAQA